MMCYTRVSKVPNIYSRLSFPICFFYAQAFIKNDRDVSKLQAFCVKKGIFYVSTPYLRNLPMLPRRGAWNNHVSFFTVGYNTTVEFYDDVWV